MTRALLRASLALATLTTLTIATRAVRAQSAPTLAPASASRALTMSLRAYLTSALRGSLSLAAERANVRNVEALVDVARVFPDPVLTAGANAVDLSNVGAQNNYGVSVSVPIEFPMRRVRRIEAAQQDRVVAAALLEDALRAVRADAATAYIDTTRARLTVERQQRLYEGLARLVDLSEQRFRAGDVGRVAVLQARVEAERFRGELMSAEAELRAAELSLARFLGTEAGAARTQGIRTEGDLVRATRTIDADALVRRALRERPDLLARRAELRAAEVRIELARASRAVDLAINLAWQFNTPGRDGSAFVAPAYHTVGATVSVPLPVSRVYRGELDAAEANRAAAHARVHEAELTIETEVRAQSARYEGAARRLELFTTALLDDAEQVFETTFYGYRRGTSTLVEVLTAQRTLNDVQLAYVDALAEHARAWVALQRVAGVWDARDE